VGNEGYVKAQREKKKKVGLMEGAMGIKH